MIDVCTMIVHEEDIHREEGQRGLYPDADGRVEDDFGGGALVVNDGGQFAEQRQRGHESRFALHHQLIRFFAQQLLQQDPRAFRDAFDGHFQTRLALVPALLLAAAAPPSHDGRSQHTADQPAMNLIIVMKLKSIELNELNETNSKGFWKKKICENLQD